MIAGHILHIEELPFPDQQVMVVTLEAVQHLSAGVLGRKGWIFHPSHPTFRTRTGRRGKSACGFCCSISRSPHMQC